MHGSLRGVIGLLSFPALFCGCPAAPQERQSSQDLVEELVVTAQGAFDESADRGAAAAATEMSRRASAEARQYIACADAASMRFCGVVDNPAGPGAAALALDGHVRRNRACYPTSAVTIPPRVPYYGLCNPIVNVSGGDAVQRVCRPVYDRGALFEYVLDNYAPDLSLSRADTLDLEVLARCTARERADGTQRRGQDRRSYLFAACVVQLQPGAAILLTRSDPGSEAAARFASMMVNRSETCRGRIESIKYDPDQFRACSADALYR